MKLKICLITLLCFICLVFSAQQAFAQDAQTAADSWLQLIDAKQYDQSWTASSQGLKNMFNQFAWGIRTQALKAPYGNLETRTLVNTESKSSIENLPAANYIVLTYNSKYSLEEVTEEVILKEAAPDQWNVLLYNIK